MSYDTFPGAPKLPPNCPTCGHSMLAIRYPGTGELTGCTCPGGPREQLAAHVAAKPAAPLVKSVTSPDTMFHAHLDECTRCRTRPFDLCVTGMQLIAACFPATRRDDRRDNDRHPPRPL